MLTSTVRRVYIPDLLATCIVHIGAFNHFVFFFSHYIPSGPLNALCSVAVANLFAFVFQRCREHSLSTENVLLQL